MDSWLIAPQRPTRRSLLKSRHPRAAFLPGRFGEESLLLILRIGGTDFPAVLGPRLPQRVPYERSLGHRRQGTFPPVLAGGGHGAVEGGCQLECRPQAPPGWNKRQPWSRCQCADCHGESSRKGTGGLQRKQLGTCQKCQEMCLGKINLEEIDAVARLGSVGQGGGTLWVQEVLDATRPPTGRRGNPAGDSRLAATFLRALERQLLTERALALT